MPLVNGEYEQLTEDEIFRRFEKNLNDELDSSAQPGDLVTKQLNAEAETLANYHEAALERVHNAAYLADADGKELEKVVDIIGLERKQAVHATGTVGLWRETPPTSDYVIPRGSEVQTRGSTPISYTITEQSALKHIDGWEDNNLDNWTQDTTSFNVIATSAMTGNHALEIPATSGVNITSLDESFTVGTKFGANYKPNTGAITGFRFALQDQSNYLECVVDESGQDLTLRVVEGGTVTSSNTNSSANIPTNSVSYLEVSWGLHTDTTATLYDTDQRETELCSVTLAENKEWESGAVSIASLDATSTALLDEATTRYVTVNIEANEGGEQANVGPNTITAFSGNLTGVEAVTNQTATGKSSVDNTNFSPLITGKAAETDEELRERAFNTTSIGGAATVNALKTELRRIEGVEALTLKRNRESTSVNGLPAHSFEAIVYGGSDKDIAQAIFNTASIDSQDVGGVNGTKVTYDIKSDVTDEVETISWSRPNKLDLDITLNLIVDDTFVGETEVRSIVVNYIGGTDVDGSFLAGLDVGESVYEAILKERLVSPEETGVWEVDSVSIDKNGDGTDDTTTKTSGADVLSVASNEVAVTNASDGSITVNTTTK